MGLRTPKLREDVMYGSCSRLPLLLISVASCALIVALIRVGDVLTDLSKSLNTSCSKSQSRKLCMPAGVSPAWIHEMHPWTLLLQANYSQGAQDLYLDKIFSVIGATNKYFVEFGFNEPSYTSGGSGPNTRMLYERGWRGLLLDGDRENNEINLHKHYLFANNIAQLFAQYGVPKELDYLSCDMDSHDLWVFRAVLESGYRPRVVTTEFNSNYPLTDALAMIDPTLIGNGKIPPGFSFKFPGCVWGTSARALWKVARSYGYTLIGRVHLFDLVWLRDDLIDDCFAVPEFEWFFRDAPMGRLHHYQQKTVVNLDKIVDYDTFIKTRDLDASNKVARAILKTSNITCFDKVRSLL